MKSTILIIVLAWAAPLAAQNYDVKQALKALLWQANRDSASISEIEVALLQATNLLHNDWRAAEPDLVASLTQLHQVYQNLVFGRGASLTEALVLCDCATVEACDRALDRLLQTTGEERKLRIYQRLVNRLLSILLESEANIDPWGLVWKLTNTDADLRLAIQRAAGVGAAEERESSRQLMFLLLVVAALLIGIIGWCLGWARGWRQARGRSL